MSNFPPDLVPRTRQILLPLVGTEDEREALLTDAFYTLSDARIYHQIKREGNPMGFTTMCIKKLLDYGCLTEGQHALAQLLQTTKYYTGIEKHPEIEALAEIANDNCLNIDTLQKKDPVPNRIIEPVRSPSITINTPGNQRKPTIFISYAHADKVFADRLIASLNRAGHVCWLDVVKIKGGDEWVKSITEGINNSYAFISIVSPDANKSTWVRREFLWAENKNKRIFPVIARESELEIYLMERQVIAMHEDYEQGLVQLLNALPRPQLKPEESETDGAVTVPPVTRRRLELDYLEKLRADVLFDLEKYTPLGGESQFIVQIQQGKQLNLAHMRPEFEHLQPKGEQRSETRRFDNAVDEILKIRRAVLLGEPGGGKTTTLLSLAGQLADDALTNPKAVIPIFVRLGRWTNKEQSLMDFIKQEMGALGKYLDILIDDDRAVPLLDGMNEIPVNQRKEKYEKIRQFITANPDWVAVTSCREQDYTIDLELDRIIVTPLDALRIREFVGRYLGDDEGEVLFWKIAGKASQRFESRFQELFADTLENWSQTFWLAPNLPDGLDWENEFINTYYYGWQEWCELRDAPGSLMQLAKNPYMLSMLTQVYIGHGDLPPNRGELFRDFVHTLLLREGIVGRDEATRQIRMTDTAYALQAGLANIAGEMQIQRGSVSDPTVVTVLSLDKVRQFLTDDLIYLAVSSNILDIGDDVRFSHQLLQEYFAAIALNELIFGNLVPGQTNAIGEALQASEIWKEPDWWERSNWEESLILLAGLYSDDCSPVVEWVNEANPEVAALCVVQSGAAIADHTKEKLRAKWIKRLTDVQNEPNPKARAAVGRALGLTNWDNREGVNVIEHKGVFIPDIDWVLIPAGEYSYQGGTKILDYDFRISRYPVTYSQFQSFIDDPEGFADRRWWQGFELPDGHNNSVGDQSFKYWNHPRERVSWYDAMAFCRWFSWRTGGGYDLDAIDEWKARLPTEFEWEKAALAQTGWNYPYGKDFDSNKGNTRETGLKQTSTVGIFPDGDTSHWDKPISDLSGNVWEWCLTDYDNPKDYLNIENISSNPRRVLRGGSWSTYNYNARAVNRYDFTPDFRNYSDGFRVCVRCEQ